MLGAGKAAPEAYKRTVRATQGPCNDADGLFKQILSDFMRTVSLIS